MQHTYLPCPNGCSGEVPMGIESVDGPDPTVVMLTFDPSAKQGGPTMTNTADVTYLVNSVAELRQQIADRDARIAHLERLLDRAYPLLHNPYTQQADPLLATTYDTIIREVEIAIQHLKEEDDPERVALPCASCDGDGCPNCAIDAILRASE